LLATTVFEQLVIGYLFAHLLLSVMSSFSWRSPGTLFFIFASLQLVNSFSVSKQILGDRLKRLNNIQLSAVSTDELSVQNADVMSLQSSWKSVVSTNPDLNEAIDEIVSSISVNNGDNMSKYNLAMFFTSSIYEASAFKYDDLFEVLSKKIPGIKTIIGCTTGRVNI
jgi:hypothetical protein